MVLILGFGAQLNFCLIDGTLKSPSISEPYYEEQNKEDGINPLLATQL